MGTIGKPEIKQNHLPPLAAHAKGLHIVIRESKICCRPERVYHTAFERLRTKTIVVTAIKATLWIK